MKEPTELVLSEPRKFPETCAEASKNLAIAIETLRNWGIRIRENSRLVDAVNVLASRANEQGFPLDPLSARKLVNALSVARDFSDIAGGLPKERVAQVRSQLQLSVAKGSLAQDETERQSYQLQSQYWIGRVLVAGGTAAVPVREGKTKSPDFLVTRDLAKYAVEVKRPMSARAIKVNIEKAVEQFSEIGLLGVVVLDITDCMTDQTPETFMRDVERLGETIDDIIWDSVGNKFRAGFESIMLISSVARGAYQVVKSGSPQIGFVNVSASSVFTTATGNLRDHHAQWLRLRIQPGLFWDGFKVAERRRE